MPLDALDVHRAKQLHRGALAQRRRIVQLVYVGIHGGWQGLQHRHLAGLPPSRQCRRHDWSLATLPLLLLLLPLIGIFECLHRTLHRQAVHQLPMEARAVEAGGQHGGGAAEGTGAAAQVMLSLLHQVVG